jgi:hypothetical protein
MPYASIITHYLYRRKYFLMIKICLSSRHGDGDMASTESKSVACEQCRSYMVYSPDGKERICLQCLEKEDILGKQLSGAL